MKPIAASWLIVVTALPGVSIAQTRTTEVAPIDVIATAPMDGRGSPVTSIPLAVTVLKGEDFRRGGPSSVLRALDARLGGVSLDQAQANPFQPNLIYRGFEASPLAGNAQGLAVYVDGVRFNQPFGDTVNWDLLPDVAVSRAEVVGSNPAFGRNALGGAVSFRLKDGFSAPGGDLDLSGGSFGRRQGSAQYGRVDGAFASYVALSSLDDDGWRDHSPSRLRQGHADFGWRADDAEAHLALTGADNALTGNGPAPAELLDIDRSAIFTFPDRTRNRFGRAVLSGERDLAANWSLQGNLFAQQLRQRTVNGDAAEIGPCVARPAMLCPEDSDIALTDTSGRTIGNFVRSGPYAAAFPVYRNGGPYALLNQTRTRTSGLGGGFQLTGLGAMGGRPNRLELGAGLDGAKSKFAAGTSIGALSVARAFDEPGVAVNSPDAEITPVSVHVRQRNWNVYLSDTLDVTDALSVTVSGRYDNIAVRLRDQLGDELDGDHHFARFNPGTGLTYQLAGGLTAYAGLAYTSRAPTPAELSCADPDAPCSLTNFFVSDPPLERVDARTVEAGFRGLTGGRVRWRAGVYRTDVRRDIQFVASGTSGRGYFTNVGNTRREGVELGLDLKTRHIAAFADYAFARTTYRTGFVLNAGSNPAFENETDPMVVARGDRKPGGPAHNLKLGLDFMPSEDWTLGVDAQASSGRRFAGDEANLNPKTRGYWLANLHIERRVSEQFAIYGVMQNVFNRRYATFGTYAPVDSVPVLEAPDLEDPTSVSPGAPRSVYLGLRLRF